jgi:membrane associated rhomboid family serine protease
MPEKVTPVDRMLFSGVVIFTALVIVVCFFFPNNGSLFQLVAGLVAGFAGALFMRLKPSEKALPPDTRQDTTQTTKTIIPPMTAPETKVSIASEETK